MELILLFVAWCQPSPLHTAKHLWESSRPQWNVSADRKFKCDWHEAEQAVTAHLETTAGLKDGNLIRFKFKKHQKYQIPKIPNTKNSSTFNGRCLLLFAKKEMLSEEHHE